MQLLIRVVRLGLGNRNSKGSELEPIASSKQAVLARSLEGTAVQEDQTSATAAAAAPQVLAEAVAPIVVTEP